MSVAALKKFQKMYKEEPATEEMSDGVKYGPCKYDLEELWEESSSIDWEAVAQGLCGSKQKKKKQKKQPSREARIARLKHVGKKLAGRLHKKNLQVY